MLIWPSINLPYRERLPEKVYAAFGQSGLLPVAWAILSGIDLVTGSPRATFPRSIPSGVGRGLFFGKDWIPPRESWCKGQTAGQLDHRRRHRGLAVPPPASPVPEQIETKKPHTLRSLVGSRGLRKAVAARRVGSLTLHDLTTVKPKQAEKNTSPLTTGYWSGSA